MAVYVRDGGAVSRHALRPLWRAVQRICIAVVLMLGAMAAANAACNFSSASPTGGTITFTGTGAGNAVGLCVSNDTVRWGLYGSSNGTNPNIDAFQHYPMTAGGTTLTNLNYTTANATYTLVPVNNGVNNQHTDEYDIQINTISGSGTDTITLWYTSSCSQSAPCNSGVHLTDTSFTITVNLPNPPTVTSISPTSGPTTGGTTVIITGTNLSGASAVKFGANNATGVTVNSSTQITATSPAGTAGIVDVTVTTSVATSATSAADQFTYVAAPTVTSISPTSGPATGGTSVVITGTNFSGATAVTFGGVAATGFNVDSGTQITATAPAGSGTVDVRVTTIGGTSAVSAADQFTYIAAPTVTSISPTSGPTAGGTSVTITGTNFTGATAVSFGGTTAGGFSVVNATTITVTSPAGTGAVDVRVTTPGGTSATSAADQFTYFAVPSVTSISPTAGPQTGGTSVVITGTNLSGATAVTFGGTAATGFAVNTSTQITATAPAGTGIVDIIVTTPGGTSAISAADQFSYVAAPTVTSISPTAGPGTGGTTVTITGTNFSGATAVTFGGVAATGFNVDSATQITATSPSGASTVDIRVTTAGGTSATSAADQFTYVATPTVTSISPTLGPQAGGTSVVITGTNFTGATAVTFGAVAATGFIVNSATQITVPSPPGTGVVDVRVTTTGGTSAASAADQFTYFGVPTVTSISPNGGPLAGGTSVTITGTNFTGATAVNFGGTTAGGFSVVNATTITVTSPAGTGTVDVKVTTPGGTSATSAADQFTYAATPTVTSVSPNAGPTTGGTSVTITGTAFSGATAVKFGTVTATGFTVNSATSITATSPPGAGAGTVDVTVTTPGGTSPTSASDQFSYSPAPAVTSISPTSGPAVGGTSITITGSGFTGATAVKFGANTASFTVNSATSITATSPAGSGTVDVTVTTVGGTSPTSAADRFTYLSSTTTTEVTSSQNPSSYGQSVTFTAKVQSPGGTPTGTVTFNDGGTPIGTSALAAGTATFATTALAVGNHTITATYGGSPAFNRSTSSALTQSVDIPADSARLRALQLNVTKVVAQSSGQAISGAIDTAISEGFSNGGQYITPGGGGMRVNFAAAPDGDDEPPAGRSIDQQGSNAYAGDGRSGRAGRAGGASRIDDAFAAIDRAAPTKAPRARFKEQKDWLFWIDVRGTGIDRWGSSGNIGQGATQATLYGQQINLLSGLTYRARPDLLVGVVGGYENFSYTQTDINGKLKGDGWTVGAYVGWKIIPTLRYDAAVTYSGIGYDGTAGTAQGNFNGNRWMFATGFTGSYSWANFNIEPSAKVYALWERENAYVDSLGTSQAARTFSSGRASAGNRVSYPVPWLDSVLLLPYAGVYADYYFTQDDAAAIVAAGGIPLASTPLLQGWSARVTGGIGARLAGGATVGFGAELGGIGGNTQIWTFAGRARIPF
nr:IPT/TIG domain-containing protein [Bradyrhizobium stylosanthis]